MSEGCVNCAIKEKDRAFEKIQREAQAYADEQKIPVAIYQENGEWKFREAFSAYAAKLPVKQVVSFHR